MRRKPAEIKRSISVSLSSSDTRIASFWRPSRGPTSISSTDRLSDTDQSRNGAIAGDGYPVVPLGRGRGHNLIPEVLLDQYGIALGGQSKSAATGQVKQ